MSYFLYAEDAAGNVATSGPFEVTVNPPPPAPAADYTLWIIAAIVIIAALGATLFVLRRKKAPGT
ncbi:MAG: hypothetical protein AABY30_00875 [Candidatus Thermoplasmatota archaeon]